MVSIARLMARFVAVRVLPSGPRAADGQDVPVLFSKAARDLRAEHLIAFDEWPTVEPGDDAPFLQELVCNVYGAGFGVHDRRRNGAQSVSLFRGVLSLGLISQQCIL